MHQEHLLATIVRQPTEASFPCRRRSAVQFRQIKVWIHLSRSGSNGRPLIRADGDDNKGARDERRQRRAPVDDVSPSYRWTTLNMVFTKD